MDRNLVDFTLVEIDSRLTESVKQISVQAADPKTAVKTFTPKRRPIGTQRGVPEFTGTMQVVLHKGELEVDWWKWMLDNLKKDVVYERAEDGQRMILEGVWVNDVGEEYDAGGGEMMANVSFGALDHREEK